MTSLSRLHRATRIRLLNDSFRADPETVAATEGFLPLFGQMSIPFFLEKVRAYADFTPGDPYAEHECGALEVAGQDVHWRIDYVAPDLAAPSSDPADPAKTRRVLRFILGEELAQAA
ncbi:MAG: DUF3768 domain-containing protein [Bauldia sp.]|nr:DUF3768 domain-containing protein [Bauldia sp.]MCW5716899.1 DUF3768 domain-containing protein [Bauldia sp.]